MIFMLLNSPASSPRCSKAERTFEQMIISIVPRGTLDGVLSQGKKVINFIIDVDHNIGSIDTCIDQFNKSLGEAKELQGLSKKGHSTLS